MENRLAEVVDKTVIMEQDTDEKMCSCRSDVVDEMCSSGDIDTCGECLFDVKSAGLKSPKPLKKTSYLL